MLQRDYFIRMIQEFAAALQRFMEKRTDETRRDEQLQMLWQGYVGSYSMLRNLTAGELITYAHRQWPDNERLDRIEMAAELLMAEGSYKANPLRDMLLGKALQLFTYVDGNSKTYSETRRSTMAKLSEQLGIATI